MRKRARSRKGKPTPKEPECPPLKVERYWAVTRLKRLGMLRDSLISSAAAFYLFGYVAWCYFAWKENLGLLPLLDTQYFMSGLLPGFLWLFVYWCVKHGHRKFVGWLKAHFHLSRRAVKMLILIALGPPTAVVLYLAKLRLEALDRLPPGSLTIWDLSLASFALYGFGLVCYLVLVPLSYGRDLSAPDTYTYLGSRIAMKFFRLYTRYPLSFIVGLCTFLGFFKLVYATLPQEFGGVKPRYALVDLKVEEVSADTIKILVPSNSFAGKVKKPNSKVVQTKHLVVLFSNADVLMVRPLEMEEAREILRKKRLSVPSQTLRDIPRLPVFELDRDCTTNIKWLDKQSISNITRSKPLNKKPRAQPSKLKSKKRGNH